MKLIKKSKVGMIIIAIILISSLSRLLKDSNTEKSINVNHETTIKNKNEESYILKNKQILLVNKKNPLEPDYEPNDLVDVSTKTSQQVLVTKELAEKLQQMFKDAKKDGITLIPVSGYRSFDYQKDIFDESVKINGLEHTKRYVATPGQSEHQTGLAIDIGSPGYNDLTERFEESEAFKWLQKNMYDYGFILRYPKGKEHITEYSYEPWHLRYVGVQVSKYIQRTKLTLEEYLSK